MSFWDSFNIILGQLQNVETISSGVSEIKSEITNPSQLPSVSVSFGGSFAQGELTATAGGGGSQSVYGDIYDPSIEGLRPATLDEAISSKNQSIANAPATAPSGYVESLQKDLDRLIDIKISQISPSTGTDFSGVSFAVPDFTIPDVTPIVVVPSLSLPADTEISESKMRPSEPQEPVKDINPPTAVADAGQTHSDFAPQPQPEPEQPATPSEGLVATILDKILQRPSQPAPEQRGGVYGESGYIPYQMTEQTAPSPFPLLIGAGLLLMALEKKTKK